MRIKNDSSNPIERRGSRPRDTLRRVLHLCLIAPMLILAGTRPTLACYQCDDNECESGYFSGGASCHHENKLCPNPDGTFSICGEKCKTEGNCVFWILTRAPSMKGADDEDTSSSSGSGAQPGVVGLWICDVEDYNPAASPEAEAEDPNEDPVP